MAQPRLTNRLKWKADLLELKTGQDEDDRPQETWEKKRTIYYSDIGITSQEKYLSQQNKQDVVLRIMVRRDTSITQQGSRFLIRGTKYKITRIYEIPSEQTMEVSLDYVDHI